MVKKFGQYLEWDQWKQNKVSDFHNLSRVAKKGAML